MRVTPTMRLAACLLLAAVFAGCKPKRPQIRLSLDQLVADYNANAGRVPRLWARAKIQVKLSNGLSWGSTSPLASPNGLLLLAKTDDPPGPQDFAFIGREPLAVDLFRIGSSASQGVYYFWYSVGEHGGRALWGRHRFAGAPGVQAIPIDPNQLLSVLSICAVPGEFTRLPTVALSMSRDPYAYVLSHLDRQPITNRILFRREVYFTWDDKKPARPFLINLFDDSGQRVMVARVKNYQPIRTPETAEPPPVMPTDIEITWPEKASKVRIVLSEMTTEDKWDVEACLYAPPAGISPADIVQVDSHLEAGGPAR